MTGSILDDVKHNLGLLPSDTTFDSDVMMLINSAFSTLTQLGVGPLTGFQIQNKDARWSEYYTDPRLNSVKSYVFLKVKFLFTPPETGFATEAMERQIKEQETRLNIVAEYG